MNPFNRRAALRMACVSLLLAGLSALLCGVTHRLLEDPVRAHFGR